MSDRDTRAATRGVDWRADLRAWVRATLATKPGSAGPPPWRDYDVEEVFKYGGSPRWPLSDAQGFSEADVVHTLAHQEGETDGQDWLAMVELTGGRFAFVRAGCDYTGWG